MGGVFYITCKHRNVARMGGNTGKRGVGSMYVAVVNQPIFIWR